MSRTTNIFFFSSARISLNIMGQSSVSVSGESGRNHLKMAGKNLGSRRSFEKVDSRSAKC